MRPTPSAGDDQAADSPSSQTCPPILDGVELALIAASPSSNEVLELTVVSASTSIDAAGQAVVATSTFPTVAKLAAIPATTAPSALAPQQPCASNPSSSAPPPQRPFSEPAPAEPSVLSLPLLHSPPSEWRCLRCREPCAGLECLNCGCKDFSRDASSAAATLPATFDHEPHSPPAHPLVEEQHVEQQTNPVNQPMPLLRPSPFLEGASAVTLQIDDDVIMAGVRTHPEATAPAPAIMVANPPSQAAAPPACPPPPGTECLPAPDGSRKRAGSTLEGSATGEPASKRTCPAVGDVGPSTVRGGM